MSEQAPPYRVTALPNAGISKEAIRLGRFIDRLPKDAKYMIMLDKVDGEWRITITEIKIEKIIQAEVLV